MWFKWVGIACALFSWQVPTFAEAPAQTADKLVIVVAAKIKDLDEDHYLWGAELAAARLKGNLKVIEGGLAGGLRYTRENPGTVRGIVEVMIDVYSFAEEVRITCMDASGREIWKSRPRLIVAAARKPWPGRCWSEP